ncbi:MAG: DUF2851 family protein [Chitinophagaceae bacterium]|nr:DUF2851 family protein [Chitinophagaceae bacterium]
MQEPFLYFIWKYQYFDKTTLQTTDGKTIQVLDVGILNRDAGPDFSYSKILIDNIEWNGNVEIHIKSSDWKKHNHQKDTSYTNVILHVVWQNDENCYRKDGTSIPQLELKTRTSHTMIERYNTLLSEKNPVPCFSFATNINPLKARSMMDRVLVERLERKTQLLQDILEKEKGDWNGLFFHALIRFFGFKVNEEGFQQLSKNTSFSIIHKIHRDITSTEAYLFGMAGFLSNNVNDEYSKTLQKEFQYICQKFTITPPKEYPLWKFLRLRPANFPPLRIAQLAAIFHINPQIFSSLKTLKTTKEIQKIFAQPVSNYWKTHYQFSSQTENKTQNTIGTHSIDIIIINVVSPILFLFGRMYAQPEMEEKAIDILYSLKNEKNAIADFYTFMPIKQETAHDSQAILELYNAYCTKKKCLECQIGLNILKNK